MALAAEGTFVARTVDSDTKHLASVIERAAHHEGCAFVEVYQNCNIFNDGAFDFMRHKQVREDNQIELQHGKPIIFGKNKDRGIVLRGMRAEAVNLKDVALEDVIVHDAHAEDPTLAFMLSRLQPPSHPTPIGILRAVERPTLDGATHAQVRGQIARQGSGDLETLLNSGDTWSV